MGQRVVVLVASVIAAGELGGCLYARGSLRGDGPAYANYPDSVEAERVRRAKRRKLALLGGPIEIAAGVGLTALALYAPAAPDDDGDSSVVDNLGDAGKEALGRLALALIGTSLVSSGVGDTVLGATDPLFDSPLVRDGALVSADEIDRVAPARGPRLGFHATETVSLRTIGADVGLGLAHWLGSSVRVRETAVGGYDLPWRRDDGGMRYSLGGDLAVERAFGRRHAGLYPVRSVGAFAGAAWTRVEGLDRAIVRGGLLTQLRTMQLRLGATYIPGHDRYPTFELGLRRELEVD